MMKTSLCQAIKLSTLGARLPLDGSPPPMRTRTRTRDDEEEEEDHNLLLRREALYPLGHTRCSWPHLASPALVFGCHLGVEGGIGRQGLHLAVRGWVLTLGRARVVGKRPPGAGDRRFSNDENLTMPGNETGHPPTAPGSAGGRILCFGAVWAGEPQASLFGFGPCAAPSPFSRRFATGLAETAPRQPMELT